MMLVPEFNLAQSMQALIQRVKLHKLRNKFKHQVRTRLDMAMAISVDLHNWQWIATSVEDLA